jgi:MHS family proline/betaine transporter-like MFS transporter
LSRVSGGAQNGRDKPLSVDDVTVTDPSIVKRAVGAAMIGNITEWFDFGVFASLQTTIGNVFLSPAGDTVKSIGTAILFMVAFTVRPIGGLFFGPLGDRIGRTKVLSITVILMAASTFIIALIPGYDTIGIAAPMLMVLARLLQGFSTGGEYGGAMTFIAEYAPDKRRGFFGSFLEFGTCTGYLFGSVIALGVNFLPPEQLNSWGWRIPFLISGPIGIIGLYLRLKLEETPAFKAVAKESEEREGNQSLREIRTIFAKFWRPMLVCMGIVLVFNVINYMVTTVMPEFFSEYNKPMAASHISELLIIGVYIVILLIITQVGRLSDRIGRKPVMFVGCGLAIVGGVPAVLLAKSGSVGLVALGLFIMAIMLTCFNSTSPSTLPALFPTEIRYGALAIAFNIAVSAFGGTTETVTLTLINATGDTNWPGYYLMIAGAIGAVAIFFMRESAGRPLLGSAPAVANRAEAEELVRAGQG